MRHPGIVGYQWEQVDPGCHAIITYPVEPLLAQLPELDPAETAWGIVSVGRALEFMHKRVRNPHDDNVQACLPTLLCLLSPTWIFETMR